MIKKTGNQWFPVFFYVKREKKLGEEKARVVYFDESGCVYNGDSLLKNEKRGRQERFHRIDSVKMKKEVKKVRKLHNIARLSVDMSVRKLTKCAWDCASVLLRRQNVFGMWTIGQETVKNKRTRWQKCGKIFIAYCPL